MAAFAEYFPDSARAAPLSAIDWDELGVILPYLIFFTGRCGSGLLNGRLADTGLCGQPDEYFNETRAERLVPLLGTRSFPDYFQALVRRTASYGRFGAAVDPFRFASLAPLIDIAGVFAPAQAVFFWLTRRDIVGQAWSYAKAKKTGLWHEYADGSEERSEIPADTTIADTDWWREIIYILLGEQRMEAYFAATGIAPRRLTYEALIADRSGTTAGVLHALSCRPDEIARRLPTLSDKTRQQRYADRDAARANFCARYAAELQEIEETRQTIDVPRFWHGLIERRGLVFW
jgi:LPS sulfotransferase NodH